MSMEKRFASIPFELELKSMPFFSQTKCNGLLPRMALQVKTRDDPCGWLTE